MRFNTEEQYVKVNGRTLVRDSIRYLGYSCSGIEFYFTGTRVEAQLWSDSPSMDESVKAWIAVFVDDEMVPSKRIKVDKNEGSYVLYEGKTAKKTKISLVKYSEASAAKLGIKSIIIDGDSNPVPVKNRERRIEFIGDSITCGYGAEGKFMEGDFTTSQENPWEAYAAKTARALEADYNLISWSGIGIISCYTEEDVPNDGWLMPSLYKYTDKAMDLTLGNKNPEVWDNGKFIPDCIVINLGTNDNSYVKHIPERVEAFGKKYNAFVKQVHDSNPSAKIICTLGAMGQDLCPEIERQVALLNSEGLTDVYFMKFDVQDEKDGIGTYWHPSLVTQSKMAVKLEQKIKEIMHW
jgi:lysophospholipase L1-like esterase